MINKGVWIKSKRRSMPPNRRVFDSKWVFKNKSYGQFRARPVAWGYTQIYRSRIHLELLTSGCWRHNTRHTTYVVDQQVGIPDYRHQNIVFIDSTRGRNLYEDTRRNGRSTWIIIHIRRYIDTDKIYIRYHTSRTLLVQGGNLENNPQGWIQPMQDWYLSTIYSKWSQDCNWHCICGWHAGNWRKTSIDDFDWIHQERIFDSINGWTRGLRRMYDQAWPCHDDPQDLSTRSNHQYDSII